LDNSALFTGWRKCARWAIRRAALPGLLGIAFAASTAGAAGGPTTHSAKLHYASLPLSFEVNRGQAGPAVKFLARGSGYTVFFTEKEVVMLLERSPATPQGRTSGDAPVRRGAARRKVLKDVLRLRWVNANPAVHVEGLDKEAGWSNYFVGNNPAKWVRNVPSFARVEYQEIYPGIDLVYYGNRHELEFDIALAPGADLRTVRLEIAGADHRAAKVRISRSGELVVHTRAGDVRFHRPRAYQLRDAKEDKDFIEAHYTLVKDGRVGFGVRGYNPAKPLVVDPVLSYSTYLGGTDLNYATGIAVDASGNTYITGYTSSVDFPVVGGVQGVFGGGSCNTEVNTAPCFDAFISKLNPQGTALIYSTYLGGTGDDEGARIAVDSSGQAYVAGFTDSLDFPTVGALQGSIGGGTCGTTAYPDPCYDAFVAKISASGSSLVYSTYLGGTGDDFASSIAADSSGNAYVGGLTSATDFPITYGALQTTYGGGPFDGFVAKINPTGSSLVYSTYIGGAQEDHVNGIAVDSSGEVYLTGQSNSSNFPTHGGFQPQYTAGTCGSALSNIPCFEAFVARLNAAGTALIYSSYLGGTAASYGSDIALDSTGDAYVTGWTTSKDFPVTPGAFSTTWGGTNEIFVAKIAPDGSAINYATYLGSIFPDQANAIAVDPSGNAWIAGLAYGGKFPLASPLQASNGGFYDAIVSEFDATGSNLLFSTYLGGTGDEAANDIALDSSGNAYVAGDTFSTDFPVTTAAMTTGYTGGSYDAWIAKISPQNAPGLTAVPNPLVFPTQEIHTTSAAQTLKLGDAGSAALSISNISVTGDFAASSQCGSSVAPGMQCNISVTFTPASTGTRTGTLVITDNAAGSPHTVKLSGYATSGAASLSASSLDFGQVGIGTSSTQSVTLTNPAQSPLDITSIQASGGDYTQNNNCGTVVNPGASCTIAITFSPSSAGTSVGTVFITDTAADSPQSITLTGTGVLPFTLAADPGSATVLVGTGRVQFTVTATSSVGYTGSIILGCANVAPATCSFSPGTISPGQSSTLTVGNLTAVTSPTLNFVVTGTLPATTQFSTTSSTTSSTSTTSSGSTTATLTLSVQFADFTLAASPQSTSIQAGQTASYTLTVTPVNGFNVPVSLACSGAPAGAACSFSSSSVQVGPSAAAQVTMSIATTARSMAAPRPHNWDGLRLRWLLLWAWCMLLAFLLFLARTGARRKAAVLTNLAAALLFSLALAACGGGGSSSPVPGTGTPAGTYSLTVTATAQSLSHSIQIALQVN
jgi:hypothetical protein